MITAVDTNVLLDVLTRNQPFSRESREAMVACVSGGAVVACEVVWAETAAAFGDPEGFSAAMSRIPVRFDPIDAASAAAAGAAIRMYRRHGGARQRVVADFLVGAHATSRADRLLTRDRGFYRSYFGGLVVVDPSVRPG